MKKMLLIAGASMLVATGWLTAQNDRIAVKAGHRTEYTMHGLMDIDLSMQGQELKSTIASDGGADLVAKKVGKEKIDWLYQLKNMKVHTHIPLIGRDIDSTIKMMTLGFSTDFSGHVTAAVSADKGLGNLFGPALQSEMYRQFFSPVLTRSARPGDTWEETRTDTEHVAAIEANIVVRRTTRYTYDGPVDTLSMQALRLRSEVTSMKMEGGASIQGTEVGLDGDGTSTGIVYYSATDLLMLVAKSDMEMHLRMTLSGGSEMIIPLSQRMTMSTVRKGL